jgi:hypothetical protein
MQAQQNVVTHDLFHNFVWQHLSGRIKKNYDIFSLDHRWAQIQIRGSRMRDRAAQSQPSVHLYRL